MKKQNNSSSSKGKGFYLSLLAGVCAVFAIALVLVNISSGQKQNNLVNLNESASNTVNNDKQEAGKNTSNVTENSNSASKAETQPQVELEGYEAAETINQSNKKNLEEKKKEEQEKQKAQQKKQAKAASAKGQLTFHKEKGLLWPVNGKVILKYSPEKPVYFSTLEQYKCNPAVIVSAKVGDSVKAAADGIVSKVTREDETGLTVTMSIGSQYFVKYGQLKNVNVKAGQSVKAGQLIGQVSKPSKYYSEEGGNLYFQMKKGNSTVDPLLYLK